MQAIEAFYASVLPSQGPYVLAFKVKATPGMQHRVVSSFDALIKASLKHADLGADSWICIGSIEDKDFRNPEGKVSPRAQKNIKAVKSLILDLDVDPRKERYYANKEEAILGLYAFQTALGLPEPTVVDSGYGFHIWWPLEASLSGEAWTALAKLLKAATGAFDPKLIADPSRVADSCGLLRTVGTKNYKRETAVTTEALAIAQEEWTAERFEMTLRKYLDEHGINAESAKPKEKKPEKNMLSLFMDEPHDFKLMLKRCKWLGHYATHQNEATEPEWYATLGVLNFVEVKGRTKEELATLLSQGHKGYSADATAKKLKQVTKAQDGPTTCERFRALAARRCEGCPYAEMVNTPVRLDMVDLPAPAPIVAEEVVKESGEIVIEHRQLLAPPPPYFRGKDAPGIYMRVGEDDDATVKRIYEYDIFPIRRLKDEETDNEMLEISLTLPMDGHRFIKIANGLLTDAKKLTAELANKGVLVQTKEAQNLTSYIIEYARKIQREEQAHEEFARFGWRDVDGDNPRFVLGDFVVNASGDLRRATPAPYLKQVREVIALKGSLEEWKKGFNVYKDLPNTEPLQFALMLAFAAPLLALTPFNGLLYNMLGDSGCGKSTALRLMASVWGKPNEHHIQVHDNRIPMFNTIGYLQSVPVTFDEITTIAADVLADIAYSITEGRGKNRADRSGNTRANTIQWKTIVCGTSNSSLYEKLGMSRSGNNAHAYRIFEVRIDPAEAKNRPLIDAAMAEVELNYGMAGRVFIIYVLKRLPEIRKLILEATVDFAKRFNMPTAERFWFTLFACMAIGGKIAKDLGLHGYDVERIVTWNATQLSKVREVVGNVEGDAFTTLSHFIQMNLSSMLVVKDGNANALDLGGSVRTLLMRFEYEKGAPTHGYISISAIKEHCKHLQVEYGWLVKRLEDTKVLVDVVQKSLGEGTGMLTGTGRCWKIDLQHPMMKGLAT